MPQVYRDAAAALNRALLRVQNLIADHQVQPDSLDHRCLLRTLTLGAPALAARLWTIDDRDRGLLGSRKLQTRLESSEKLKHIRD